MSMRPEIFRGNITSFETNEGIYYVPSEYFIKDSDMYNIESFKGTIARLSMPGFLDCTDWIECNNMDDQEIFDMLYDLYGSIEPWSRYTSMGDY